MKRTISALICILFVLTMLIGCASTATTQGTATTAATTAATTTAKVTEGTTASTTTVKEAPKVKFGMIMPAASTSTRKSYIGNIQYLVEQLGGEFVHQVDTLTDPEAMITNVEKCISAGCNAIMICPPNDSMLIKVAQLCEEAEVYWSIVWRNVLDENVRSVLANSNYYCGLACQDDSTVGYDVAKLLAEKGHKNIAIVSLNKSQTTSQLREKGIAKAAEEFGLNLVAEARDLMQADDAAAATESFLSAYPELDCIFIVGSMGENLVGGIMSALEQHDSSGKVKIAMVDFLTGMQNAANAGVLEVAAGGIHINTPVWAASLPINAVMMGGKLENKQPELKVKFTQVYSAADMDNYFKYFEGTIPFYTIEEAKQRIFKFYNSSLTIADLEKLASTFKLDDTVALHSGIETVPGYTGVTK